MFAGGLKRLEELGVGVFGTRTRLRNGHQITVKSGPDLLEVLADAFFYHFESILELL